MPRSIIKTPYLLAILAALALFGWFTTRDYFTQNQSKHIHVTLDRKSNKIAKKDRIDLAMRQEFDMTRDPKLEYIPKARLKKAQEFRESKIRKARNSQAKISGVTWTERGPDNVGGRTRALMWDPNDAGNTKVWAGSVTGGLWYNDDITSSASTWQNVSDMWNNISISAITYDPNNTDIMYLGTGEGHVIGSTRGEGMYKSIDGGSTWTHMTASNGFYATDNDFHYVNDIIVKNEGGSSVIYVAVQNSVNEYTYHGYSASGEQGLFRSTDGGVNFTQVLPNVPSQSYTYNVADIELSASGRIFVGTTSDVYSSSGGGRILYSDNGTTWATAYNPGSGRRVELACAPSNAGIVYAIASDGNNVGWMVKTTVGDQASPTIWSSLTVPSYTAQSCNSSSEDFTRGQAWYDLIMAVHPTDANTVVIGGIDLYRSTDGGNNFSLISYWTGGCDTYVHADQHMILFNPNSVDEVIFGNDGGVFYSADLTAGNPSISARNNGYNVTQFYGAAIHPTAGTNHFLAGAQDNGSHRFGNAGMNSTTEVSGGDGAYCNIDQDEPNYQWTQYVYNNFYRSTNGGTSFSGISEFGSSTGRFINPSRYDDTNNIMYSAAGTDQMLRWSNAQTGSTGTFVTLNSLDGGQISAITVSPNTSNRLFVGTGTGVGAGPGGKVYRIDNANMSGPRTATDISSSSFPANSYVSCVEVENGDDNHILVVFSNYGVSSIWETVDGGTSWTEVEGDLPDMPVRWALFHPLDNNAAIIATELGVWTTSNLNGASTTWGPADSGFPNVRTDMLQLRASDNEVIAATHGRGLFSSSSFATAPTSNPEISFLTASTVDTETSQSAAQLGDCRPYKDHTITMTIANPPTGDATVTLSLGVSTSASEWDDFVFTTNGNFTSGGKSSTLLFADGATDSKTFTLRVYDDGSVESAEVVEFEFAITGSTNAIKSSTKTTHTFTINDNDEVPGFAGTFALLEENFEGGATPSGWTVAEAKTSVNDWRIDTENAITGTYSAHVSSNANTGSYNINDDAEAYLITPLIDASGYTGLSLSFNYKCNGEYSSSTYWDYGMLAYSFNGSSFTPFGSEFQGVTSATAFQTALPADLEGTSFYLAFVWINDTNTGSDPAFVVDDVSVTATGTTIATTLNYASEQYLGPNETVMFYDEGTGELLAKIENTSSHDYGCTTISIDRSGTGTKEFWSADVSEYLMDKTVFVSPANNNISGTYNITLYYTPTEVNSWIASTGKTVVDLKLAKVNVSINDINSSSSGSYNPELGLSNSAVAFGDGYAITSSFTTGFSGFGAGDPGAPPLALPIKLLTFEAEPVDGNVDLVWTSAAESNSDYIEIEHATDGKNFSKIGRVEAAGNSTEKNSYAFMHKHVGYGNHYYRLKMIDVDGSYEYSWVETAFQKAADFSLVKLYPVPVADVLTINYNSDNSEPVTFRLIDNVGNTVYMMKANAKPGYNITYIDSQRLNSGIYVLSATNKGRQISQRIVIR
ncbi:T9SS type A sorting domain-containing protein [Fulvivirga sp. 29W222]|uniref:T9SS type A sorting domain-containing protein n=1 Tax=Fulvivirga marina TaxID=2494733 RepID=A0A937KCU3_9BACT|nr:T9SS type A sorting domain-containing protein [Fulvivirga marina]MBL6448486.1 T9SS type A sorting domain-containing protein [Fulvivirga marina]